MHRPTFDEFRELAREATVVPVYRKLVGDTLTPVTAFCKIREGESAFLFESVVGGERMARYSFLGAGPFARFLVYDRRVRIEWDNAPPVEEQCADPLHRLEAELERYRAPRVAGLPRFTGGAVGYAGYDTARYVERLPNAPPDDRGLPDLCFALYDRMVVFDHFDKTVAVVAHAHIGDDLQGCYRDACRRVDQLVERLHRGAADVQLTDVDAGGPVRDRPKLTSNFAAGAYESAVRRCQEYIQAGDIFQVVLSQRWQTETRARPFDIYRALRVVSPSPFMFFLQTGPATLIGASPEILARVEDGTVTVRPLAGTRPRGATPEDDTRLADELRADPKECAEHVMLVDLGRNDVGRIAEPGTVELRDLMTVERYSHVMHLSSTVTGKLRGGLTAFDALRSCLPAGTLSGAPKIRAMEIIDELEPHRRGPYGGAVGYIDFGGQMDTCIALRTLVMAGQTAWLQAGAGIVADSDPEAERRETENKAKALLKAIAVAEEQL